MTVSAIQSSNVHNNAKLTSFGTQVKVVIRTHYLSRSVLAVILSQGLTTLLVIYTSSTV